MNKKNVTYRLDEDDKKLIVSLAKHFGISETDVVRMLVRKSAREEGVKASNTE
jgi:antitoxin component of RelBE/YafQ-DinJ toxin-antitoxin module